MKSSDPIVGIDVGTSKLSASIWREEMAIPEVLFRARGDRGVLDSTLEALPSILRSALGRTPARAVITVPSAMDWSYRIALPGLLDKAGLRIERVLSTSTSAALTAGLLHQISGRVAVIDLGAHSLDVCIIEIGDGVYEVLSTHGDNRVGGRHLDRLLINWVAENFRSASGIDLQKDPAALRRLLAGTNRTFQRRRSHHPPAGRGRRMHTTGGSSTHGSTIMPG
jgi:molecular chaperone DnaK (HSP70)